MSSKMVEPEGTAQSDLTANLLRAAAVVALLFVFLMGVRGLGDGFTLLGKDLLDSFFKATSNPFVGLMVGLLATTLMQSSSVTTSMIVALVAAPENPLPVMNAVPMIMGANIGTTVTNTIVALAHIGRPEEFRRAFAVATCHDFFNFIAVIVLLPLEIATGFLSKTAAVFAGGLANSGAGLKLDNPLKTALEAALDPIQSVLSSLSESDVTQGVLLILISGVLIFVALLQIVKVMRAAMLSKAESSIEKVLGRSAILGMTVGVLVTGMVQSSSITTSLLVPLAGAGLLTLEQAFPVTLGANIGTTLTALMASLAVSGPNAEAGVVIALTHLMFNLAGTALIYPVAAVRRLPLTAARKLADVAVGSKVLAIVYVAVLFYALPALFAYVS
jgi:sodium-dependent phosphate cotransporter